jgi:cytochrome d ubiquinol oxidase subunit II
VSLDLPLIWAGLIGFSIIAYVVLDGFDLGIGILFPAIRKDKDRDTIVNSVAPVWDGNETWLVLGGGGLLAAFPLAYAVVLPALYAPLIAMLLGLIFRGVAFEFRFKAGRTKYLWDIAFFGGSVLATFTQGIVLGAFVQGIEMKGRAYAGGWWDWLTPFSLFTGLALVVGYAVLGVGWLIMKTTGDLQDSLYRLARPLGLALLACVGIVSLWTPLLDETIASRWFSWPNILYLSPVPVLVVLAAWMYDFGLRQRREALPFLAALAVFLLSFAGLGISLYPHIIPPAVTIWDAAAPEESLWFLLIGAVILLPLVLAYTAHAYWVFRGKVDATGYH